MNRPPRGRIRPIVIIIASVAAIVLGLMLLGHRAPAFHALSRDAITIVVALGIVALIRAMLPRREQRRRGERRHGERRLQGVKPKA